MTWASLSCSWFPVEQVKPQHQVGSVPSRHGHHQLCGAACGWFSVNGVFVIMPCCLAVIPTLLEKFQALVSSEGEFLKVVLPLSASLRALWWLLVPLSIQAGSEVLTSLPAKALCYQNWREHASSSYQDALQQKIRNLFQCSNFNDSDLQVTLSISFNKEYYSYKPWKILSHQIYIYESISFSWWRCYELLLFIIFRKALPPYIIQRELIFFPQEIKNRVFERFFSFFQTPWHDLSDNGLGALYTSLWLVILQWVLLCFPA